MPNILKREIGLARIEGERIWREAPPEVHAAVAAAHACGETAGVEIEIREYFRVLDQKTGQSSKDGDWKFRNREVVITRI